MDKKRTDKFIEALKKEKENNSIYLWGGSGESVRNLTIGYIEGMEQSKANAGRVLRHIADLISSGKGILKARAFDCSGLIIEGLKVCGKVSYDFDTTAQGLFDMCVLFKPVSEAVKGDLVFKADKNNHITHVGAVTTKGYVIEARGRDYGVVARKLTEDKGWAFCGTL